jgi:hypothetical protein
MSQRNKKRRKQQRSEESETSSSGLMGSLRGGMKRAAGAGPAKRRTPAQRALDIVFWLLIIAALVFFVARRF